MSTEVATRQAAIHAWDAGFQRLVKQTVLKPKDREATAAELALLAEQAVRTGLDPMSRQIYGIYRKSRGQEVMTLQVGIDGLRTIAERTGCYLGQSGPYWCGKDGKWSEIWTKAEPPAAAKVIVRKVIAGQIAETPAVAHYDEYVPTYDGKPTGLWKDKPALMVAKCAEALALRKAFPQDMSGLYTDDEMARVDVKAQPVAPPLEVLTESPPVGVDEPILDAQVVPESLGDPERPEDDPMRDIEPPRTVTPRQAADLKEFAKGLTKGRVRQALSMAGVPDVEEAIRSRFASVPEDRASALVLELSNAQSERGE